MVTNAKTQILQERCKYYEYTLSISADNKKPVTITCPNLRHNISTSLTTVRIFDSVEQALLWFVTLMQKTNKRCREYGVEPVWKFEDVLLTYRLGHDGVPEQK